MSVEKSDLMQRNNYTLLYDSSKDAYPNYQNYHHQYPPTNRNHFHNQQPTSICTPNNNNNNDARHPLSQLNEFMFGNGLYSNDLNLTDTLKLHVLPSLPLLKSCVLINMSFYLKIDKRVSRVSIGLVIPIGVDHFSSVLFPNWEAVKFSLAYMKDSFIENHYDKQMSSVCNTNNFADLSRIFKGFIKSLNNLNNIPRLLPGLNKFDSILYNWCFEVNNWIEMKDGGKLSFNNGSKFLSALLTTISVVKNQLVSNELADKTECTRVVVVASNPGVAQKLIFLISELLPFELDFVVDSSDSSDSSTTTRTTTSTFHQQLDVPHHELHHSLHHSLHSLDFDEPRSSISCDNSGSGSTTLASSESFLKDCSPSTPSFTKKGWEIPVSSAKSINSPSIEIVHSSSVKSSTLSTSNSMAYLSSSLSNSQSSVIPSSLTRGFQLLQNWKSSIDFPTSSISSHTFSNQSFPSPYSNTTNNTTTAATTTSTNAEYEEYPWSTSATTNNPTPTISSINPNAVNQAQFNERHVRTSSVHQHRSSLTSSMSRNNSYYDLSNVSTASKIKKVNIPKLPHMDRNSSTLYGIGESCFSANRNGYNGGRNQRYKLSQAKCRNLMNCSIMPRTSVEADERGIDYLDIPLNLEEDEEKDFNVSEQLEDVTHQPAFTTLPLTCSYINEYSPEFQLQACPPQADLDNRILNSMKLDVNFGGYKSCKSIIISLRSREIKQLGLELGGGATNETGGPVLNVTNKKIYGNSKINWSLTPKENFNRVDSLIEEILVTFQNQQIIDKGAVNFEDLDDDVRFKPFIKFRELLMAL